LLSSFAVERKTIEVSSGAAQKATEPYWTNSLRFIDRKAKMVWVIA
jgi:hypothetical protein